MRAVINIILFIVFIACSYPHHVSAQDRDTVIVEDPVHYNEMDDEGSATATETTAGKEEATKYERLYMDEYKLEALRRKKEFQYHDMDSMAAKDSIYFNPAQKPAEGESFKGFDASIFMWLIIAVAAIAIILQFSGVHIGRLFTSGRIVKGIAQEDITLENIHDIPYENAIRQAIQAKNYTLATRLMYLQSLKLLCDKNLVIWHENKTNWQYVFELKNEKLRNSFRTITHIFEYVQYGNMPLNEEKFTVVQESFREFKMNVI
jgi:hypothetical protein